MVKYKDFSCFKAQIVGTFSIYEQDKSQVQLSWIWKKYKTSRS